MSWWVGGYIEAGMSISSSGGTPYLPFVFQDSTKAQAQKDAGAKLLAGPFSTQSDAQSWANSYEASPSTLHAGSGLSTSTGTVTGDSPPSLGNIVGSITGFHGTNFVIRAVKIVVGAGLLLIGLAHLTGADNSIMNAARNVKVVPV